MAVLSENESGKWQNFAIFFICSLIKIHWGLTMSVIVFSSLPGVVIQVT
jgi:hypothetical protein